jgi:hypothetical protein
MKTRPTQALSVHTLRRRELHHAHQADPPGPQRRSCERALSTRRSQTVALTIASAS